PLDLFILLTNNRTSSTAPPQIRSTEGSSSRPGLNRSPSHRRRRSHAPSRELCLRLCTTYTVRNAIHMKKSLRFGAVALAATATLTLASCGFGGSTGGGGDAEGETTLNLLVPSYSDATKGLWEDVIDGFEKENPDIKVDLEVQS